MANKILKHTPGHDAFHLTIGAVGYGFRGFPAFNSSMNRKKLVPTHEKIVNLL